MLTTNRAGLQERRGIALILILGMLGLLAFIGVTFATIAGQARIGARNYAQSVMRPQPAELMEFALSQLIGDSDDAQSAIRGHSMARDMYGNDAQNNGYLDQNAGSFQLVSAVPGTGAYAGTLRCVTNILAPTDATAPFYGYDFTRWVAKFDSQAIATGGAWETRLVGQTYEIVYDDALGATVGGNTHRIFYLAPPPDAMGSRSGYKSPDTAVAGDLAVNESILIGEYAGGVPLNVNFTLDGRFLRAFNGPGMGPLAQYANMRYNGGMLAGNDAVAAVGPGDPNVVGMDEDYDACDLENWFLAIQSADGHVVVPSFHRPAVVQYTNPKNNDWVNMTAESRSRILRPRQADGHDVVSFPDLMPQGDGTLKYDVDNDADGITDSVWVDLGYPPIRDNRGLMYKPMFAFMVLGLNGRIPLNSAGNLSLRDGKGNPLYMNASHLGYSPSEVDPTFGLQNWPVLANGLIDPSSQLDNAQGLDADGNTVLNPISVNVTQVRNILAGTRLDSTGTYADNNFVFGTLLAGKPYYLPNNVPDLSDSGGGVGTLSPRTVAGRWGEASFIPSYFNINTITPLMVFPNLVRAGMSVTGSSLAASQVFDGRDDNNTARDFWPSIAAGEFPGSALPLAGNVGGWPADYYDAAGDRALFAERARRFVAPMDITGDGKQFNYHSTNTAGADEWGRVRYNNYFRPPGVPVATLDGVPVPTTIPHQGVTTEGIPSIYDVTNNPYNGFESQRNPSLKSSISGSWSQALRNAAAPTSLDPDGNDGAGNSDGPVPTSGGLPFKANGTTHTPTFDASTTSLLPGTPGLNEPNETALYHPDSWDQIFGAQDLEWLYRAHDQDGSSLYSRLSELAPLSFRDSADALRRRRMYSIDTWETNSFAWSNDNPGGYKVVGGVPIYSTFGNFGDNSRFLPPFTNITATNLPGVVPSYVAKANAGLLSLALRPPLAPTPPPPFALPPAVPYFQAAAAGTFQSSAPSLAHRDRKINLNYPLPVSNESTEPTRLKWIAESYQFLKAVLPPLSIDTPEELAELSQFLINIVDFRDPDATMTRFVNPDVFLRPSTTAGMAPDLVLRSDTTSAAKWLATDLPLVQYGMEYNPIAINEVLAYAYQTKASGAAPIPRFFIELVNTLTDAQTAYAPDTPNPTNASWLNLGGVKYVAKDPYGTTSDTGGCWDLIFTDDDPSTRPDPFTGQLPRTATTGYYGPIPLHRDSFTTSQDVVVRPLDSNGPPTGGANYYYCLGNTVAAAGSELNTPSTPKVTQTWSASFDPIQQPSGQTPPTFKIPPGVLPNDATKYPATRMVPPTTVSTGSLYKWVCLRRPANPFKGVGADNPMIVVDSMRFPFIEGTGMLTGSKVTDDKGNPVPDTSKANQIYSIERFQPYRGGHLVPQVNTVITGATPNRVLDVTRYGYTEQSGANATSTTNTQGIYSQSSDGKTNYYATKTVFSSLGAKGSGTTNPESWERFVFNDRDFTSPAELTLVPGCPPGLFTKQFVEVAPSAVNKTRFYNSTIPGIGARNVTPPPSTTVPNTLGAALGTDPPTFPYLVDRLFYTSGSPAYNGATTSAGAPFNATHWHPVVGPSSGGWYKMFEVFEVPSPVIGATGTVAQGVNYDWLRQDVRPGQLNLNLIMDEEVFLGLMGNAGARIDDPGSLQQVTAVPTSLNGQPIAGATPPPPRIVTQVGPTGLPTASYNMTNSGFYDAVVSGTSFLKQAFGDFLSIRHGAYPYVNGVNPALNTSYLFFGAADPKRPALPHEAPFRSLTYPDINYTIMRPAFPTRNQSLVNHGMTKQDAGVKNVDLVTRTVPFVGSKPYYPPAMPPRRLFQLPDYYGSYTNNSNAARILGDTNQIGYAPPAIPTLQDPNVNLANNTDPVKILNSTEMHPYYRSEWLQKLMNLSTVRTHQYAVWVTVGFFEVTAVGDPASAQTNPTAAYDVIGREVGTLTGKNFRHRAFFIVDRLKLGGFDPRSPGNYQDAVLYRKIIQ